jgi:hypothetical protein
MPSSIPAVVDAVLAMLRARPELAAPVEVWDGFPRRAITDIDLVAVGGKDEPTADGTQDAVTLGNRRRDETYTLRVYCSSSRGTGAPGPLGADQKVTRDRAFALMAAAEAGLRADPTLGGLVISAQVGGRTALQQTDADTAPDGSFAEVSFDVSVRARI